MWLPTQDDGPAPSSALVAPAGDAGGPTHTAPWAVPALRLEPDESVALLRAVSREGNLAAGTFAGADLRYLGGRLPVRGSACGPAAIPAGHHRAGRTARERFGSRCSPATTVSDWRRSPRACRGPPRASTDLDVTAAPDHPAIEVLGGAVATLLDHLVRSAITATARATNRDSQSAHDLWLAALLAADGRLARGVDADRIAAQIAEWRRPIATAERSPFRLCFRLEEPDASPDTDPAPDDDWYVRYLLQSYADPSLLIPSADGWDGGVDRRLAPVYGAIDTREFLLSELGQAAGISTRVARSLEHVRPDGFQPGHGAGPRLPERRGTRARGGRVRRPVAVVVGTQRFTIPADRSCNGARPQTAGWQRHLVAGTRSPTSTGM